MLLTICVWFLISKPREGSGVPGLYGNGISHCMSEAGRVEGLVLLSVNLTLKPDFF